MFMLSIEEFVLFEIKVFAELVSIKFLCTYKNNNFLPTNQQKDETLSRKRANKSILKSGL